MNRPSSASPSMKDQPSRLFGRWKRLPATATGCGAAGSRRAASSPSSATAASSQKMVRGPLQCASTAPSGSATTGPSAMKARERPLRRAAPTGSAVASACVERLKAAKHRPQTSRSGSSNHSPESVA